MRDIDIIIATITEGVPAQEAAEISRTLASLDKYLDYGSPSHLTTAQYAMLNLILLYRQRDPRSLYIESVDPDYYTDKSLTNRELQEMMTAGLTGILAVDVGAIMKYLYRFDRKNGESDLLKAIRYLEFIQERDFIRELEYGVDNESDG